MPQTHIQIQVTNQGLVKKLTKKRRMPPLCHILMLMLKLHTLLDDVALMRAFSNSSALLSAAGADTEGHRLAQRRALDHHWKPFLSNIEWIPCPLIPMLVLKLITCACRQRTAEAHRLAQHRSLDHYWIGWTTFAK